MARKNQGKSKRVTKTRKKRRHAELLKLAQKYPPPQSWFDETDIPFVPTKN